MPRAAARARAAEKTDLPGRPAQPGPKPARPNTQAYYQAYTRPSTPGLPQACYPRPTPGPTRPDPRPTPRPAPALAAQEAFPLKALLE